MKGKRWFHNVKPCTSILMIICASPGGERNKDWERVGNEQAWSILANHQILLVVQKVKADSPRSSPYMRA